MQVERVIASAVVQIMTVMSEPDPSSPWFTGTSLTRCCVSFDNVFTAPHPNPLEKDTSIITEILESFISATQSWLPPRLGLAWLHDECSKLFN